MVTRQYIRSEIQTLNKQEAEEPVDARFWQQTAQNKLKSLLSIIISDERS